jgi:hypothetical protein
LAHGITRIFTDKYIVLPVAKSSDNIKFNRFVLETCVKIYNLKSVRDLINNVVITKKRLLGKWFQRLHGK